MLVLSISFVVSLLVTLFVVRYQHLHAHISADHDLDGVQKFHATPVPRVGGLGVVLGVLIALLVALLMGSSSAPFGMTLLLCASPAFAAGFVEDITKKVGVKERLIATAVAGLLGGLLMGGWISHLGIPLVDQLFAYSIVSILVTCIAISGVANAYNIIDGYNGLAGVVSIIVLLGLAYVSYQVGDHQLMQISFAIIGGIAGFLMWNFPRGLIFLGDGGAYFIGFAIAEISVLLVTRNSQVSPWFPLLLSFYPIFETVFSIYRKKIKRGMSAGVPDGLHLHMLIYKRVVRWAVGPEASIKDKSNRNALTSPYLWLLSSFAVIPAILFWDNTLILELFAIAFAVFYIYIYRRIVRSKVPFWMIIRSKTLVKKTGVEA